MKKKIPCGRRRRVHKVNNKIQRIEVFIYQKVIKFDRDIDIRCIALVDMIK